MTDHSKHAVFILTHGRPENVITLRSLRRSGYTGQVYLLIDNEDPTGDEYRRIHGADNVIVFDKAATAQTFDTGDLSDDRRAAVYARNAVIPIARGLGLDYLTQMDDDYLNFTHRWLDQDGIRHRSIRDMDAVYEALLTFLDTSGTDVLAFAQGGDFIGGSRGRIWQHLLRKAMNVLIMRTDTDIRFVGRMNDDVSTYVLNGMRGRLFFTVLRLQMNQPPTQAIAGGMSDLYRASGTYTKSFFTVMQAPSCSKVAILHAAHPRIHHRISWNNAVPAILSDRYRKAPA